MKILIKLLSLVMIWAVVIYMILFVDPDVLKDVGIQGIYLPFVGMVVIAMFYTAVITSRSLLLALVLSASTGMLILLSILDILNAFIVLTITAIVFFAIYTNNNRNLTNKSSVK